MAVSATPQAPERGPIFFRAWLGIVLLFLFFGIFVLVLVSATPHGDNYEAKRAEANSDESSGGFWQTCNCWHRHFHGCDSLQVQCTRINRRPSFRIWRHAEADRRSNPLGAENNSSRCLKTSFCTLTRIFIIANRF